MIKETVLQWVSGLDRRIEQYLIFEDLEEEHEAKLAVLSGKERTAYEMEVLGGFLASEYYNADFDVWPDDETRIDSLEDLLALADNDLEQRKLENAVRAIFRDEEEAAPEPKLDNQQNAFFDMMTQAFGVNSEYDAMETSMTEISEYLKGDLEAYEDPEEDSFRSRLAEMMDDHMDSF